MTSATRLSVVVPLYNKARYVSRCLDSICAQTYPDFEVIVVNDGSTDGGDEIVRNYRDARIRLISQQNAGPGSARNRGASEAGGELIAMLDSDDEWEPHYLEQTFKLLETYGAATACLTWAMLELPQHFSTVNRWRRIGIPEGVYRVGTTTPARLLAGIVSNMLPSSTVIRKDVVQRWSGFYSRNRCLYAEDAHLWLKVLLNHDVAFRAEPAVLRHCDASELAINLAEVRPIEPFLLDPDDVRQCCPRELLPLLRTFLAIRACKTASVYGYYGLHKPARELMRNFVSATDWDLPFFFPALIGCTPAGKWAGAVARTAGVDLRDSKPG